MQVLRPTVGEQIDQFVQELLLVLIRVGEGRMRRNEARTVELMVLLVQLLRLPMLLVMP